MRGPRFDPLRSTRTVSENYTPRPIRPLFTRPKHSDDAAVESFATEMAEKLDVKRAEGCGGWDDKETCSNEFLSRLLREHVEKGDPVDVANFAMMIHQRGERIAALEKETSDV